MIGIVRGVKHSQLCTQGMENVFAEANIARVSSEALSDIPAELARDIARRIRDAAEMGDVMTLNAIAEEIKTQSVPGQLAVKPAIDCRR
jgi:hypothetical protein